jgi:hypothetical protein
MTSDKENNSTVNEYDKNEIANHNKVKSLLSGNALTQHTDSPKHSSQLSAIDFKIFDFAKTQLIRSRDRK